MYVALPLLLPFLVVSSAIQEDENLRSIVDLSYLGDRVFKEPNPEIGKRLENWNETSEVNPEELGEYAEGDILFPTALRNGLVAETSRWKNGVIPYEISGRFQTSDLQMILKAMDIYHKYTCVSFRKRQPSDADYISIANAPTGCWSSVGRVGGKQEVNLQSPSCTTKVGTPIHELMHAAGFLHEQNRYERDDYVTIAWQNIKKGHDANFNKADKGTTNGLGVPYDFRSVMHYSSTAFSVNGQPTIIPKDSSKVRKMGQRDGFSKGDLTKINNMYNCPEKTNSVAGNTDAQGSGSNENKENSNPIGGIAEGILNFLFHKK